MTKRFFAALVATSALTAAMPAFAQNAAPADEANADDGEIIVNARRTDERLQDVPVSVQVVTGDALQKLSITQADEISKLAPGLTLTNAAASTAVILRGVAWKPGSGTPATPIFYNEVAFDPANTIVSLYDVSQIEVLKGPQGTTRGAPSISGAVTITTTKPNLTEFGGYVQGFYGTAKHWDVQAAVNLPIIKDVLALRLATNIENSEGNRIYSVNSAIKPKLNDRNFRATLLAKPTDTLTLQAMFQARRSDRLNYDQVVGTGSPGAAAGPLAGLGLQLGAIPANFNGPALTFERRASVQDLPNQANDRVNLLTVNASWEVLGQQLTYNFGRQITKSKPSFNSADPLNMLPGYEPFSSPSNLRSSFRTHEIRLSSGSDSGLPFEYDLGWYSKRSDGVINFAARTLLSGAFGSPTALPGTVRTPNEKYVLNSSTNIAIGQSFESFYGNARVNLGEATELSGGVAFLKDRVPVRLDITTFAATSVGAPLDLIKFNFPAQFRPLITSCEALAGFGVLGLVTSTTYPGVCDSPVPAGIGNSTQINNDSYKATIYNFALSHKFTDDVMVFAKTGSSFRTGLPAINNTGLPANLVTPGGESAKTYELGIKTSWGRRLRLNATIFQIDYDGQLTAFEGINYWNTVSSRIAQTSIAFYRNVNSRVRGFEFELDARPTDQLSLAAKLSYNSIKSRGGSVPCNDPAKPAISATNPINFCNSPVGQVLNQNAPFSATVNADYTMPLGPVEGYIGFNLSYQGNNPNFGNFATGGAFKPTPSYAVVDLYAGVTGGEGAWKLGFYAKNLFNKQAELARIATLNNVYGPYAVAPSGYDVVRASAPREVGVTLRYAFGSR
jgi:iron complex outermembrane recepter protein